MRVCADLGPPYNPENLTVEEWWSNSKCLCVATLQPVWPVADAAPMSWQIFTDGASSPDGRGGWAYVVVEDGSEIDRVHGSAVAVTHQRMEIRAVAEALLAFPRDVPVTVVGDSAYAIDCFVKEWHVRWEQNGWRNSSGKPVANRDEWERAFTAWRARSAETTWDRVKGHGRGKHPWNGLADELAVAAKSLA